jgi:hypothetical protein
VSALAAGVGAALLVAPPPTPAGELDPYDVSPGLIGFLVVFAIVLACIPLFRSMTGKLRKVEHRARTLDAGAAAGDPAAGGGDDRGADGGYADGGRGGAAPADGGGPAPRG